MRFIQDCRYALRMLARSPGFTVAALLTLALGIGANTAIFSVVNSMLLTPLPFPDADRLVVMWGTRPEQGKDQIPLSLPNFFDVRNQNQSFESMAAWTPGRFNLTGHKEPEQVQYALVSANFFSVLGVNPARGRGFLPHEDDAGGPRAVVISHSLWQRRFDSDPHLIGKSLNLDGQICEIVGIAPPEFRFLSFPSETDVWAPFSVDTFRNRKFAREVNQLGVIAHRKSGTRLETAESDVAAVASLLRDEYPEANAGLSLRVASLRDQAVENFRPALFVLLGAVAAVLLIACSNVANLMLARGAA